jgi:hypothetical protein
MQINECDEQFENAQSSMHPSFQPGSNRNVERDVHSEKQNEDSRVFKPRKECKLTKATTISKISSIQSRQVQNQNRIRIRIPLPKRTGNLRNKTRETVFGQRKEGELMKVRNNSKTHQFEFRIDESLESGSNMTIDRERLSQKQFSQSSSTEEGLHIAESDEQFENPQVGRQER